MAYSPQTWTDGSTSTPVSAARLSYMESGIQSAASTADNALALASAGGGGGGGAGGGMPVTVASNDAPAAVKAAASYVCDGVNDEVQINAALVDAAALSTRNGPGAGKQLGRVELSGGRFIIQSSILMYTGTWLQGQGVLTDLRASGLTGSTGAGTDPAVIKKVTANTHLCRVSHLMLDGNFAAGGGCHGIYFEGGGSTSRSDYPDSNPDTDHWVTDLFIHNFTTGTRHGLYVATSTGTATERGGIFGNLQIRQCSGDGVSIQAASDWRGYMCHIGGAGGYGVRAAGGNTELNGIKCFFCDTGGFIFSSGRCIATGCVSQDSSIGFFFDGAPSVGTSLVADTSDIAGIQVSTANLTLTGFSIFTRSGGRYATGQRGLWMDATYADLTLLGQVDNPNITSTIVGTAGARSFMRVTDGVTLTSVG